MFRKIKLFFRLPREEKRLFLEAYFYLGIMRVLILTVSFKRLTRSLNHSATRINQAGLSDKQTLIATLVGQTIAKAANNTPWESTCLTQVLTAQKMLEKRNIPGVFYLGAKKIGAGAEKLEAHAWLQCDELIITGEEGHESFAVLAVYGWGHK